MTQVEILLALSGGAVGSLLTLIVTGRRERATRRRDAQAVERAAVAAFLGRIAEVQQRLAVLTNSPSSDAVEAFPHFESVHRARMALVTEYARTRLDVSTPSVRSSIDRTFRRVDGIEVILGDGAHGEPYPVTMQRLSVLNSHVSTHCEQLLRDCEATIGAALDGRRGGLLARCLGWVPRQADGGGN